MTDRELLHLEMSGHFDSIGLRHLGRRTARLLGLTDVDATRVATSISELGRLAEDRAPVTLRLALTGDRRNDTALLVEFGFPGAAQAVGRDLERTLTRLMDAVTIEATNVRLRKNLPAAIEARIVAAIRDELLTESGSDPGALLQSLNEELVVTLTTLREREAELVALNAELDQTNRGVVALYAELERRAGEVRRAQRAVFEELADALRPPAPAVPSLDFAVRYLPAQANSPTGGDLYDWFLLRDGTLHVTVVDVRGHGVAGTRDALHVTHAVRTLALEGHKVGELLERADQILRPDTGQLVATALLLQLDPATGLVRVAAAGHPPLLRVAADGAAEFVESRGRPIGYEGAGSRGVTSVALEDRDSLFLYTDGLTEISHDVVEGMEALRRAASETVGLRLEARLDAIMEVCTSGAELGDDTLLIGLRWRSALAP